MGGLLDGVRVLDLTNVLAGPFCCYQLAQLSAEVIKVEQPQGGDLARQLGADRNLNAVFMGASFLAQNAGKRSITLDLKSKGGRAAFEKLVAGADVLVENFRPGVMERLGFGYERLAALNPAIVVCAISGFGQTGPLSQNPAYDQIVQGMSGVMSITGDEESAPLRVGYPVCDTIGGMTAAFAIAAALVRRACTGEGEAIDVSMLEASLATMGWPVSNWLVAGQAPRPLGNRNMTAAPSGLFETAQGQLNIAANQQRQFVVLCDLVERPELATDPRFADREDRKRNRAALDGVLTEALRARPAREWAMLLNRAGVPAGELLSVPEALDHPQVASRDFVRSFPGVAGREEPLRVTRGGFRLRSGEPGPATPPPELGADTDAILAELGYGAAEIEALRQEGAV